MSLHGKRTWIQRSTEGLASKDQTWDPSLDKSLLLVGRTNDCLPSRELSSFKDLGAEALLSDTSLEILLDVWLAFKDEKSALKVDINGEFADSDTWGNYWCITGASFLCKVKRIQCHNHRKLNGASIPKINSKEGISNKCLQFIPAHLEGFISSHGSICYRVKILEEEFCKECMKIIPSVQHRSHETFLH